MSPPLLSARGVTVTLAARAIVQGASLDLQAGELVTLVGPNGAGKTTLMRALAGLLPAQGQISVNGQALSGMAPRQRARSIAYLPQGHVFHWPMKAADVVALGRHPHADPFSPAEASDGEAVRAALARAGAAEFAGRPVTQLSGGERARVALARALATQAPLLLADEPTASLDPRHQLIVMGLLRDTAHAGGGVLAVVHDLALAARFSDRVMVMDRGRLMLDGIPAVALSPKVLADIFGIEAVLIDAGDGPVPQPRRPL